ncbi:DoxX family protein [Sinomicrobium weinanense]|uniref:DoxX family protein n=1 Tax=Sinomicrobium weinanense TaxID=2842200 RepID=A0A926JTN7_9FLAO|nr:DoxX family protein [Sinomicrobium weinanense]MBC9797340.1 DoxX family protein [Sinomicrobium weinanense]MBU3124520.1 DoxX family protein [Sinomicrobium weinanense]
MITTLKIINSILILIAVTMGLKQGWAMFSGSRKMIEMFSKWDFSVTGLKVLGVLTLCSALMILFSKTFVYGNVLMASTILLIIGFHLNEGNLKGVLIELPFFLLNLIIIYLKYPLPFKNAS